MVDRLVQPRLEAGVILTYERLDRPRIEGIEASEKALQIDAATGCKGVTQPGKVQRPESWKLVDQVREELPDLPLSLDDRQCESVHASSLGTRAEDQVNRLELACHIHHVSAEPSR
jgi:hypothetical protein